MPRSRSSLASSLVLVVVAGCGAEPEPIATVEQEAGPAPPSNAITRSAPFGATTGTAGIDGAGNATYEIPIAVPPGVAGMQPRIALQYASGAGDGLLGVGWGVSGLSRLRRCPLDLRDAPRRNPVAFDATDGLCLDGEPLVLVSGAPFTAGAIYSTLRERSWRIRLESTADDQVSVAVDTDDGRIRYYGLSPRGRRMLDEIVFEWAIEREADRFGNSIDYLYFPHTGVQQLGGVDVAIVDELLPEKIRYTSYTDGQQTLQGNREVRFRYEERPKLDQREGWWYGARQRRTRRLDRIETFVAGAVIRSYRIAYDNTSVTRRSRIASVTECDRLAVCKAPTTFDWSEGDDDFLDVGLPGEQSGLHAGWMMRALWLDLDGNGASELLYAPSILTSSAPSNLGYTWRLWTADSETSIDTGIAAHAAAAGARVQYTIDGLDSTGIPQYQEDFGVFSVSFDRNGADDALIPVNLSCSRGECASTRYGMAVATDFVIISSVDGLTELDARVIDDGAEYYSVIATDLNGDGFEDIVGCVEAGNGWKGGRWRVGLHGQYLDDDGDGYHAGYQFTTTAQACSVYDEYEVFDYDGDGAGELLVIPAYPADAVLGTCFVGDEPCPPGTIGETGTEPIPDDARLGHYQALDLDPTTVTFDVRATGLPRDTFQRWRDESCQNSRAHSYGGEPQQRFGAGRGNDKIVDVNGDGLADVLRFELSSIEDPDTIFANFNGFGDTLTDDLCGDEPGANFGVRVYINHGGGEFVAGPMMWADHGDPQVAYWQQFVPAQPIDWNRDGMADLLWPTIDDDTDDVGAWEIIVSQGGLEFERHATPFYWPVDGVHQTPLTYADADLGVYTPRPSFKARVSSAIDLDADTMGELVWIAGADNPWKWPQLVNVWKRAGSHADLLHGVTDGLGRHDRYSYAPSPEVVDGAPAFGFEPHVMARALTEDAGLAGDSSEMGRITSHRFATPMVDVGGRGFVGFASRHTEVRFGETAAAPVASRTDRYYYTGYDPTVRDYPRARIPMRSVSSTAYRDADGDERQRVVVQTAEVAVRKHGARFRVVPTIATQTEYELSAGACDGVCDDDELAPYPVTRSTTTEMEYDPADPFDLVQRITTTTGDGHERVVERDYTSDPTAWLVGLVTESRDTATTPDGTSATRTRRFSHDATTGALSLERREPDDPTFRLTTQYHYTLRGNVDAVSTADADGEIRGETIDWTADSTFPASTTVLGMTTHHSYDAGLGVQTQIVDPSGVAVVATYDGFARPTGSKRLAWAGGPSDGSDRTIEWEASPSSEGAVGRRIRTLGGQDVYEEADRLGRVVVRTWRGFGSIDSAPKIYQRYRYDVRGQLIATSLPTPSTDPEPDGWERDRYDGLGRIVEHLAPDDASTVTSYSHLTATITDPDGKQVVREFDELDQLVVSTDHLGTSLCIVHGPFGLVRSSRPNCQAAGPTAGPHPDPTTWEFDRYGRLESTDDPIAGERTYTWSAFGDLRSQTDELGQTTSYAYDGLGREISRSDASGDTTTVWDVTQPGRLAQQTTPEGVSTSYGYDSFGRAAYTSYIIDGIVYATALQYDAYSRVSTMTYPSVVGAPIEVVHSYDGFGHLRALRDGAAGPVLWTALAVSSLGQVTGEQFANGVWTQRSFDPMSGRPMMIETASGATTYQDDEYKWTPGNDLRERIDHVHTQTETFAYDDLHRLSKVTTKKGASSRDAYTYYDRLGNITSRSGVGTYTYDPVGRLTKTATTTASETYDLDDMGRVITRNDTDDFTWDARDRIAAIERPAGTVTFTYDAVDRRVKRTDTAAGRTTITIGDHYERTIPIPAVAAVTETFKVRNGQRVVAEITRVSSGMLVVKTRRYLHDDHLGSVVVVTNAAGAVDSRASYDAWGSPRVATNWLSVAAPAAPTTTVGYTGHRAQPVAGDLVDMKGRLYAPRIGRFISPDPVIQNPGDGRTYNRYSYVWNRPLTATDPSGFEGEEPEWEHDGAYDDWDQGDDQWMAEEQANGFEGLLELEQTAMLEEGPDDAYAGVDEGSDFGETSQSGPDGDESEYVAPANGGETYDDSGVSKAVSDAINERMGTGTAAHGIIGSRYRSAHPGSYINQRVSTIAKGERLPLPGWKSEFAGRPDIYNPESGATYEIKTLWTAKRYPDKVEDEVDYYVDMLHTAGLDKAHPGGADLALFGTIELQGQVYAYGWYGPGVIAYAPFSPPDRGKDAQERIFFAFDWLTSAASAAGEKGATTAVERAAAAILVVPVWCLGIFADQVHQQEMEERNGPGPS
jgi:RHS repeat-associated protein